MKSKLIIFGTGSMARVLTSFVGKENVVAYCADDEFVKEDRFLDLPLIKLSQMIEHIYIEGHYILLAIGYHEMNSVRKDRYDTLKALGYKFAMYIDESLKTHDDVHVEPGLVIYEHVTIHTGCKIGENVFISSNVSLGHDCVIGNHAWINSGVSLGGGVTVGERCVLSMNSCVAHGVSLAEGTFVGAGALVTSNTKPNSVIVSNSGEFIQTDSTRFLNILGQP